jgi:two-component system response regulator AtoC
VRELENSVERAVVLTDTPLIGADILPEKYTPKEEEKAPLLSADPEVFSIKEATARLERELIIKALKKTDGNRTKAAKLLDLSHRALLYKLHDYNIK